MISMATFLLLTGLWSPVWVAAISVFLVLYARWTARPKPLLRSLIGYSVLFGLIGAGSSLAYTIFSMQRYEAETGYSAGNGPLSWIFFYGPASVAAGQIAALAFWWFRKAAPNTSDLRSEPSPARQRSSGQASQ